MPRKRVAAAAVSPAEHPPVAELLADMAVEIDAARLLAWRAAWTGATDQD